MTSGLRKFYDFNLYQTYQVQIRYLGSRCAQSAYFKEMV